MLYRLYAAGVKASLVAVWYMVTLFQYALYAVVQIGIILSSLGVLSLSAFNFLQIVELLNIIYCLAELMEFAAFIYLRYSAPDLVRYTPLRVHI